MGDYLNSKVIIFDLGEVLITCSKSNIARKISLRHWFHYFLITHMSPSKLRSRFFYILSQASKDKTEGRNWNACDEKGNILPFILCELQCGLTTTEELRTRLDVTMKRLADEGFFVSQSEQIIMQEIINITFNPIEFAAQFKTLKRGLKLLKFCTKKRNQQGDPAHTLVILSNFDAESFAHLYNSPIGRKLFADIPIERIIISGKFQGDQCFKPNKSAFEHIMKITGVHPRDMIFIDDQNLNINAAANCGITTFQFYNKGRKIRSTKKKLKSAFADS